MDYLVGDMSYTGDTYVGELKVGKQFNVRPCMHWSWCTKSVHPPHRTFALFLQGVDGLWMMTGSFAQSVTPKWSFGGELSIFQDCTRKSLLSGKYDSEDYQSILTVDVSPNPQTGADSYKLKAHYLRKVWAPIPWHMLHAWRDLLCSALVRFRRIE